MMVNYYDEINKWHGQGYCNENGTLYFFVLKKHIMADKSLVIPDKKP
jgi:hypothetical protein